MAARARRMRGGMTTSIATLSRASVLDLNSASAPGRSPSHKKQCHLVPLPLPTRCANSNAPLSLGNLTPFSVAFSPCGRYLALVGLLRTFQSSDVWALCVYAAHAKENDVRTNAQSLGPDWTRTTKMAEVIVHQATVRGLAWSTDSNEVYTVSEDMSLGISNFSGTEVAYSSIVHSCAITSVVVQPDEDGRTGLFRSVITGSSDGVLRRYLLPTDPQAIFPSRAAVARPEPHHAPIVALAFTSARSLVTGDARGTVALWAAASQAGTDADARASLHRSGSSSLGGLAGLVASATGKLETAQCVHCSFSRARICWQWSSRIARCCSILGIVWHRRSTTQHSCQPTNLLPILRWRSVHAERT
ncbi:hypothetical protein BC828DRAFT_52131 [Blastocladiella britannica]|nr:hypothetical protein BC828DRAFT_52131 [Blastocladiella britannica]